MNTVTEAEARHHIANLLGQYTAVADTRDVEAGLALLENTRVTFPWGGFATPREARTFLTRLWGTGVHNRHDVTNLVVTPTDTPGRWRAQSHFTRWVLDPDPVLDTLGEYALTVDDNPWQLRDLTITRTWARPQGPTP